MSVTQIVKIRESDYTELPASMRDELDKFAQTTGPVRILELPLSVWNPLQQEIRSRFPGVAFEFSGGLSTIWVTIQRESKTAQ